MRSEKWDYIFKHSKRQILLVVVSLTSILSLVILSNTVWENCFPVRIWFADWAHPILETVTFVTAIYLWVNDKATEWKNSLEKKLTVHFKYKDNYVMSCYEAFLSGEGDIRQWGQQIGRQMAASVTKKENYNLTFDVWINAEKSNNPIDDKFFLYTVTFFLTESPFTEELLKSLNNNYIIWIIGQKGNNPSPSTIKFSVKNLQPKTPLSKEAATKYYKEHS